MKNDSNIKIIMGDGSTITPAELTEMAEDAEREFYAMGEMFERTGFFTAEDEELYLFLEQQKEDADNE